MHTKLALLVISLVMVVGVSVPVAQAYLNEDVTIDKYLEKIRASEKAVEIATSEQGTGSGTPYFALDGVASASGIAAAVFGGIGAVFFLRGRNGRYAAQGRG